MAGNEQGGKPKNVAPRDALIASAFIAALLIVGAIVLLALDKDIQPLLNFATIFALPMLAGLGAVLYSKVGTVESNVNGRITELIQHAINSMPISKEDKSKES